MKPETYVEPDGDNDIFEIINDIVKNKAQNGIFIINAYLLKKCVSKWETMPIEENKYGIPLKTHISVINDIIHNLQHADICNFKEIHNTIKTCEKIMDHLERFYQIGKYQMVDDAEIYIPEIYRICLFMINSFNVNDTKEIYNNFYRIKPVIELDKDKLYEMLEQVLFYNEHLFIEMLNNVFLKDLEKTE